MLTASTGLNLLARVPRGCEYSNNHLVFSCWKPADGLTGGGQVDKGTRSASRWGTNKSSTASCLHK